MKNFGKSSRGRSQGIPKILRAPIYMIHRISAIFGRLSRRAVAKQQLGFLFSFAVLYQRLHKIRRLLAFFEITSKKVKSSRATWLIGRRYLRFHSPQPDTSLHRQTTDTGLVHRAVCLFTPQLSLVLTVPTHGGMVKLS